MAERRPSTGIEKLPLCGPTIMLPSTYLISHPAIDFHVVLCRKTTCGSVASLVKTLHELLYIPHSSHVLRRIHNKPHVYLHLEMNKNQLLLRQHPL